jgi:hypothetical protein
MELPDNSVPDPEVPQITVLTGNQVLRKPGKKYSVVEP